MSAVAIDDRLRVNFAPVEELIPYARNARKHTPEQVSELMGSMQEWGWTNPVLADGNGIVAGHGRVLAASKLYELGKTIKLPSGQEIPAGMVPVIDCSGWSTAQRQAYVIADNKLALNAQWDYDILKLEVDDLKSLSFDVSLLGFNADEFKVIADGWNSDIPPPAEPVPSNSATVFVRVEKDEVATARTVIDQALTAAGITYDLK